MSPHRCDSRTASLESVVRDRYQTCTRRHTSTPMEAADVTCPLSARQRPERGGGARRLVIGTKSALFFGPRQSQAFSIPLPSF